MPSTLLNSLLVLISLSTTTSVLLHDMRLDKMMVTALAAPVATPAYEPTNNKLVNFSTDMHTHTERHAIAQVIHDLKTPDPRVQPRGTEDKKHLMPRHAPRGYHAFDNYNLPLV